MLDDVILLSLCHHTYFWIILPYFTIKAGELDIVGVEAISSIEVEFLDEAGGLRFDTNL